MMKKMGGNSLIHHVIFKNLKSKQLLFSGFLVFSLRQQSAYIINYRLRLDQLFLLEKRKLFFK